MVLTHPTYLWALLGLLIPLAIHLLSRKEGKVLKVGSIRHLTESATRQFRSIRFNEWVLFVLRAVAVVLFVLLLAGLHLSAERTQERWILIEPGSDQSAIPVESLDSLQAAGYELRYFTEGFPPIEDEEPQQELLPNYPYLLAVLAKQPVEALVFSQNRLSHFKGSRRPMPANVHWMEIEQAPKENILQAVRSGVDSVRLLIGSTKPESSSFARRYASLAPDQQEFPELQGDQSAVQIGDEIPIRVLLIAPETYRKDVLLLQAAIAAVAQVSKRKIETITGAELSGEINAADWVISFDPALTSADHSRLIRFQEQFAAPLLAQVEESYWLLTSRLDRELAQEQNLPLQLASILLEDPELEQRIASWDQRRIDEAQFFKPAAPLEAKINNTDKPLDKWLILLLIAVVIAERSLAFFKRT